MLQLRGTAVFGERVGEKVAGRTAKQVLCRARLFNFTFPGFPAIHYFQAKIVSSILGGLAPIFYLHDSA